MRHKEKSSKPELIDLRSITRDSHRLVTTVSLFHNYQHCDWLIFGQSELQHNEALKQWTLKAYLRDGITDPEHDSAYAIRLPLVGLQFDSLYYHETKFTAWVDPVEVDDFHVPPAGYDPLKVPGAEQCTDCEEKHLILPEGFYVPKVNLDLYEKVRGQRVEITVGFVSDVPEEG